VLLTATETEADAVEFGDELTKRLDNAGVDIPWLVDEDDFRNRSLLVALKGDILQVINTLVKASADSHGM